MRACDLFRQGANGYVLSMGTKIWDPEQSPEQGPEQTPEQGPEWKILTFRADELGSHSSIFGQFWTPKWPGNGNPSDEKS